MRNIYEVNGKTYIIELEPEEFNTFTGEFISNPDTHQKIHFSFLPLLFYNIWFYHNYKKKFF